jgi:hypothetical protein
MGTADRWPKREDRRLGPVTIGWPPDGIGVAVTKSQEIDKKLKDAPGLPDRAADSAAVEQDDHRPGRGGAEPVATRPRMWAGRYWAGTTSFAAAAFNAAYPVW